MLEEDVALKCQIDSGSLLRHRICNLLLTSESCMAGATVPPEVLQDVSGCKLLASAFGFGLVQYDLVGCPSFSYIKVFETFWRKMDSWMHSKPVFKRFNRSPFCT